MPAFLSRCGASAPVQAHKEHLLQDAGPSDVFSADMEAAAWPAHYKRVSSGRNAGSKGAKEDGAPATQAAFCFAVSDGRLGSITVTDRGVKKRPVTAPHWTVTYVDRLVVTSIAAIGDLVFIGDSDGILYQWNTATGKTMVVPAGMKVIRKIALGPPGSAALDPRHGVASDLARLVLLYGDGSLGVCFPPTCWFCGPRSGSILVLQTVTVQVDIRLSPGLTMDVGCAAHVHRGKVQP